MAEADHYDVIVVGQCGPGGASLAHRLAGTGKRILMLERGNYLPRSSDNWKSKAVFVNARLPDEGEVVRSRWQRVFIRGLHYFVGGRKVYGGALFRLRERDFVEVRHKDGISPAWPLSHDAFEPYYTQAEALYHVHGERGEDRRVRLRAYSGSRHPPAPRARSPRLTCRL